MKNVIDSVVFRETEVQPQYSSDTVLAIQCLRRPGRHLWIVQEPEVQWSPHRSWSDASGRDRPGQKSPYPRPLLDLLQGPPYACESWCLVLRLPLWRDVAAELHAPGLLSANLLLSTSP